MKLSFSSFIGKLTILFYERQALQLIAVAFLSIRVKRPDHDGCKNR
jgi:hypothetical protein